VKLVERARVTSCDGRRLGKRVLATVKKKPQIVYLNNLRLVVSIEQEHYIFIKLPPCTSVISCKHITG
jgi:hypothetical protein